MTTVDGGVAQGPRRRRESGRVAAAAGREGTLRDQRPLWFWHHGQPARLRRWPPLSACMAALMVVPSGRGAPPGEPNRP